MHFSARTINDADLELIMKWRMDPDITKWMNTNPTLTLDGQRRWLQSIENDKSVKYWLLEVNGAPAGVLNLSDIDINKRSAEWGYYVGEKKLRSLQFAVSIELSLYAYCFECLGLEILTNDPLEINEATIRLHEMCGSRRIEVRKNAVNKDGVFYNQVHMEIDKNDWQKSKHKKYERIQL